MSERIDHAAEAVNLLRVTVFDVHGDDDRIVAIAQVHATLALVEQQRIANLLEAGEARVTKLDPWDFNADLAELQPEIREALGL